MLTSNLSQASTTQAAATMPTLVKGSFGDAVAILQQMLNFKGFSVDVDRQFGRLTEQAVKDFQSFNGLVVDGIVATNTWHQMSMEAEYYETY